MKNWIFGIFAAFILTGCSTMQVSSDYDPGFSFGTLHTFAVLEPKEDPDHTLTYAHINRAVSQNLSAKGYTASEKENANFYVLYHIDVRNVTEVQTDYNYAGLTPYPYNYYRPDVTPPPPYPYIDPYDYRRSVITTTHTYEYQEGKLILDIFDPASNKVIWRGIAKDEIHSFKTAQKKIAYINKVINELMSTFPNRQTIEKQ